MSPFIPESASNETKRQRVSSHCSLPSPNPKKATELTVSPMLVPSSGKDHPPRHAQVGGLSVSVDASIHGGEGSPETEDEFRSEVVVMGED